jgi:ubiquitin-activating enzyme E1
MGHEAQKRMMTSSVVLIGCSGVGMEIAKNVVLAGISTLTLIDPLPPNSFDLGANFYLQESQVLQQSTSNNNNMGRAQLCQGPLSELNPYVTVQVPLHITDLTIDSLVSYITTTPPSCVVVTIPLPTATLVALNDACRSVKSVFISTLACGVFGQVFCDFGIDFIISDVDGNPPASSQIESIVLDHDNQAVVIKVLEDQGRHGLETNDVISLGRLQGVSGLDDTTLYRVQVTGPYTFELQGIAPSSITLLDAANTQGYITQVKQPVVKSYHTYAELLEQPGEFMFSDFSKMDRPILLHAAFRALAQYSEQTENLPLPGDKAAMQTMYDLVKTCYPDVVNDAGAKRILAHFCSGSRAQLPPMCASLGGIVGQEVLKACSGKFNPMAGFFYLDADECLPDEVPALDLITPTYTSRYDSQVSVFGKDLQEKMCQLRYFLVGAGAIGCEMLKNWALMGVGCGTNGGGSVMITDLDKIEKSNLSRQFLFRNKDIDQFKSSTAAKAAQAMNRQLNITAFTEKVGHDTEHVFGDDFYDKLDGVCTALDNVEARLYVDQRCLFYRLPLLESGTVGTKGNTQVVVPHLTENYGATRDPPEKGIPVCTLKHFPNQIQHTLQWARDWFEGEFSQSALDVNAYLSTPTQYYETLQPNTKLESLRKIRKTLVDERPRSLEDCVVWARLQFESLFYNQIRQLLHNFPPDQVTSSGTKFWSGSKRCPKPLVFDLDDVCADAKMKNHLDFIMAAANLRAQMYGLVGRNDEEYFRQVLKDVMVPDFVPQDGVKIAASDAEESKQQQEEGDPMQSADEEAQELWNSLPKPSELAGFHLHPIDFDKDVDDHMLFVTACSNLRAMNYSIPTEDTHRSRAIAGRIIPAIATTTALVTGLICFELYKIVGTPRKQLTIEAYKNAFCNLAIPFMTLSEPTPPAKTKCVLNGKTWEWTAWDSLDMNLGDITLGDFMEYFSKEYNLDISMLSHGVSILYSFFANKKKVEERKAMRMSEVITSITNKEFPPNQLFITLEVIANDLDTDEEVELPYIKFRFR